jgi:hypothetical protein
MTMDQDGFDQHFVWFEWGFVSPDELPTDSEYTPVTSQPMGRPAVGYDVADEDWRWMT